MMRSILLLIFLFTPLLSMVHAKSPSDQILRLAATTSIENSGLLEFLLPRFLAKHPYKIDLTIVGSGKALRLARTGNVDVVWVHSPSAEMRFIDQGYGTNRQAVMRNDFVLAGPVNDPANISAASNIFEALQLIALQSVLFVSRGDDSGTNKKELSLWKQAGIDPYGTDWYLESGVGMAASLVMAEEENAYIFIDRATYEVRHGKGLNLLLEDSVNLTNPYSVIAVNPDKNQGVNEVGALELINWLGSEEGQALIASYAPRGQQLYFPLKEPVTPPPAVD